MLRVFVILVLKLDTCWTTGVRLPAGGEVIWVPGALSPGIKRPGHEADHSFRLIKGKVKGTVVPVL
jgi:hypothetical protein